MRWVLIFGAGYVCGFGILGTIDTYKDRGKLLEAMAKEKREANELKLVQNQALGELNEYLRSRL